MVFTKNCSSCFFLNVFLMVQNKLVPHENEPSKLTQKLTKGRKADPSRVVAVHRQDDTEGLRDGRLSWRKSRTEPQQEINGFMIILE